MARLIKRYGNRKLYDTRESRYVTLDAIADMVRSEEDLRIIDNDSGEDLTAVTFAQVIYEEAKRSEGEDQLPALRWIIQQGGQTLHELLSTVDRGREALENVGKLAEDRIHDVRELLRKERDKAEMADEDVPVVAAEGGEKSNVFDRLNELLEIPQRQLEQVQERVDTQLRTSLERLTNHPAFKAELQRIEANVRSLDKQLGALRELATSKPEEEPKKKATKRRAAKKKKASR